MIDPHAIPGVTIDPATAIVLGAGILGVGAKADKALKIVIFPFAAGAFLLCAASAANAANLSPVLKAPIVASTPSCTLQSCTGIFAGGSLANAGGNLDVIGTGLTGLASNGLGLGAQGGYEFWNGQIYAAFLVRYAYDFSLNATGAPLVNSSIKDRSTYGAGARLGYSLASAFGAAVPSTSGTSLTVPQALLASLMTPYINLQEVNRHGQPALVSGAGFENLIANGWTANADYYHYTFNQGGAASGIGMPITQTSDNEFVLSINHHW
ncbi:MAG: hypothetical protein ACHP7O_12690 [Burkholderiales bacterium]